MPSLSTWYTICWRLLCCGTLYASMAWGEVLASACDTETLEKKSKARIEQLYQQIRQHPLKSMPARIQFFSEQFVGKPYALTALGEGLAGDFDQAPLYRVDAFDCQTFVETVLALARSESFAAFKNCLQHMRYAGGKIAYSRRHHFLSPDWNSANSQQGLIQDITPSITNAKHQPVARLAKTTVDVANWYRHKEPNAIRRCHVSRRVKQKALHLLKKYSEYAALKFSEIAYIPMDSLLDNQGHANQQIMDQIPSGAIIEIVRPDWDLTETIGTHLNVSHLGFAIREGKQLYFYQALASQGAVIKTSLAAYLADITASPTIKGINIQHVLPRSA